MPAPRFCLNIALVYGLLTQFSPAVRAEDLALGSIRLRGGIDANPTLLPGGRSSPFVGVDGAFAIGRERDGITAGLVGEMERTEYSANGVVPSERYKLSLEVTNSNQNEWSLRSSSSIESTHSATLRSFEAVQRLRVERTSDAIRPFLLTEAKYGTLNEVNAIITDFLPEDQRYGRLTAEPGVKIKHGNAEIGTSVSVSATRYTEPTDFFGFRRDNERVEPFLFGRYESKDLTLTASVSRLWGFWHDVDFTDVHETLYNVSLSQKVNAWTFEAGAKRFASDTTFPISPLTITQGEFVKLSVAPDSKWTLGVLARRGTTRYLDSPYSANVLAYGGTASYALFDDMLLTLEVLRINSVALNGTPVEGGVATLSISKKFSSGASEKQWAANMPPIAPTSPLRSPSRTP